MPATTSIRIDQTLYDQAKADAVSDVFKRIPRRGRHTLELDNGNEFARFGESEKNGAVRVLRRHRPDLAEREQ